MENKSCKHVDTFYGDIVSEINKLKIFICEYIYIPDIQSQYMDKSNLFVFNNYSISWIDVMWALSAADCM